MNTLQKLLKIVNDAYPDGQIAQYIDLKTGNVLQDTTGGDTLAEFIAIETVEVGAEGTLEERRSRVAQALRTAVKEIEEVIYALELKEPKPNE